MQGRRQFLQLGAGVMLAAASGARPRAAGPRVVIAGGGIIGASIAYHLAKRGAAVTLLEKARPAGGATEKSFAWINATFSKQPWGYFLLNRLGIEAWQQVERELGGALKVAWNGSVEWYPAAADGARLREEVRRHQQWGYAARMVAQEELHKLEPNVMFGPVEAAAFSEVEGHVDPVHAVEVLLEAARRSGARVETSCEVTGLDRPNGRLRAVRSTKGDVEAETLVLACGVDTPRVAAMAGLTVPLKDSPGVLVHTPSRPRVIERVVLAPGAHLKQKADGRIVAGVGFGGTPTTDASKAEGERLLKEAARFLPELTAAGVEKVTLGWRPLPKDDHPIVGFPETAPDVYVTVMHSGVTLSCLIGRLAAFEILDRVSVELLDPYRLSRFS